MQRWVRGWSPTTRICVMVVACCWGIRILVAAQGWYIVDDFVFKYDAATQPLLSFDYLFRSHYGNLMPASMFVEWIRVRLISGEFWTAALIAGFAFVASSLLLLRLLRMWVRNQAAIVFAMVWFCVILITSETQLWWSVALNGGLMLPFLLAASIWGSHFVSTGRRRDLALAIGWYVIALGFYEKAVTYTLWVAAAILVWRVVRNDSTHEARRRAFLCLGVVLLISASYLMCYMLVAALSPGTPDLHVALQLVGINARLLVVTLFGGPWRWWIHYDGSVTADPSWLAVTIASGMAALVIAVTVVIRRHAWLMIATTGLLCLASALLLWLGRASVYLDPFGAQRAVNYRYSADLVVPLACLLAILCSGALGEKRAWRASVGRFKSWLPHKRQTKTIFVLVAAGALMISAGFSWRVPAKAWAMNNAGNWAGAAVSSVSSLSPTVEIINQPAPSFVDNVPYSFYTTTQSVLAPMVPVNRWIHQSQDGFMFLDDRGFVGAGQVAGQLVLGTRPNCGAPLLAGASSAFSFARQLDHRLWIVQLDYGSTGVGDATVGLGSPGITAQVTWARGQHSVFFTMEGQGSKLVLQNGPSVHVCVKSVTVGQGRLINPTLPAGLAMRLPAVSPER